MLFLCHSMSNLVNSFDLLVSFSCQMVHLVVLKISLYPFPSRAVQFLFLSHFPFPPISISLSDGLLLWSSGSMYIPFHLRPSESHSHFISHSIPHFFSITYIYLSLLHPFSCRIVCFFGLMMSFWSSVKYYSHSSIRKSAFVVIKVLYISPSHLVGWSTFLVQWWP